MSDVRNLLIQSAVGSEIKINSESYINFGGSQYLGLQGNPECVNAGIDALKQYGITTGIPRHYSVASAPFIEVERAAANYFDSEAALYFSSGYLIATIALGGMAPDYDLILLDELAHYSVQDAVKLSGKRYSFFKHCRPDDLGHQLATQLQSGEKPLVVSDGVFATFGELAPLDKYWELIEPLGGALFVDDSHSAGVLGPNGRGAVEHFNLSSSRIVSGTTLSKAFCAAGAVITGRYEYIEKLRTLPVVRGACAGSTVGAAVSAKSLAIARQHPGLRHRVRTNTQYLRKGIRSLGIEVNETPAPIVTFRSNEINHLKRLQADLMEKGIYVLHSNYIGAGEGGAIRCGVFADHTEKQIDYLISALKHLL